MNEKILFVDDDLNLLDSFKRNLRGKFQFDVSAGAEDALELIKGGQEYAVIVSDMKMPGMNGIDFLTGVKEISPDSIRIMLTGHADINVSIDAVNKGAIFRFLLKPCDLNELEIILNDAIELFRKNNKDLQAIRQSSIDALTGLYNRGEFDLRLNIEEERIKRYYKGKPYRISIVFIDLDNFKYYNDSFGHDIGDVLLQEFAKLLGKNIRKTDFAARYGGDEFVIIMPESELSGAIIFSNRVLNDLKGESFFQNKIEEKMKREVQIEPDKLLGCSIGISCFNDIVNEAVNLTEMVKSADQALLQSKNSGKNKYTVYEKNN